MPNAHEVEDHAAGIAPSSDSIDMSNLADSLKGVVSQGARPQTASNATDVALDSKKTTAAAVVLAGESVNMNALSSLSVSEVLKTAHLKPPQDNENEALERLWASSAEVDHQLESIRKCTPNEDILTIGSEVQDAILKKGTSYRSFFKRSKSARATMA